MTKTAARTIEPRVAAYHAWRSFIDGNQADRRPMPGETQTAYNYARALVRKSASYVFPQPVSFEVVDDKHNPIDNNDTEHLLMRVYAELDLHEFDIAQEEERSTIGDAAEKITWDTQANRPRIVSVDPASITATTSPDNPTEAISITQEYTAPGWALAPYGINATDKDAKHRVIETWLDDIWSLEVPALNAEIIQPNPYGWIPYLVLPNRPQPRSFWGTSDLEDIKAPSQALNRAMGIVGNIIEFSGAPIAVLEGIDSTEGIRVRPGAKWELPEGAKAYLIDLLAQGGLSHHQAYIDQIRTTLHDLSETPRTAFGDTGRTLSGAALEIEIQPMVQKTKRKRAGWDRLYTERNRRILSLLDQFGGEAIGTDRTTRTVWAPILPADDDALVAQQVQLVGQGIRSRYTANKILGTVDPENELKRIAEETPQEDQPNAANTNT